MNDDFQSFEIFKINSDGMDGQVLDLSSNYNRKHSKSKPKPKSKPRNKHKADQTIRRNSSNNIHDLPVWQSKAASIGYRLKFDDPMFGTVLDLTNCIKKAKEFVVKKGDEYIALSKEFQEIVIARPFGLLEYVWIEWGSTAIFCSPISRDIKSYITTTLAFILSCGFNAQFRINWEIVGWLAIIDGTFKDGWMVDIFGTADTVSAFPEWYRKVQSIIDSDNNKNKRKKKKKKNNNKGIISCSIPKLPGKNANAKRGKELFEKKAVYSLWKQAAPKKQTKQTNNNHNNNQDHQDKQKTNIIAKYYGNDYNRFLAHALLTIPKCSKPNQKNSMVDLIFRGRFHEKTPNYGLGVSTKSFPYRDQKVITKKSSSLDPFWAGM